MARSRSYGRNALRGGVSFSAKGLDDMLERIKASGRNVDAAVARAVAESAQIPYEDMRAGAARHKDSGAVYEAIEVSPVTQVGDFISCRVGIDLQAHPEAFHAVYQEYGDGHSPGFPDPFIRPAFDNNKSKIRKRQKEILIEEGLPLG